MAVVSVSRLPSSSGAWNRLWERRYERRFRITCDDREDGPVVIRTAVDGLGDPLLPVIGSPYVVNSVEKDLGSFLADVQYSCLHAGANPNRSVWEVVCRYEPYDAATFGPDPIAWPIRVQFGGNRFERIVWVDQVTGDVVANSAGDRFDPPLTADDTRSLITITRNELVSTFDWTLAEQVRDSVNDGSWNGYGAKTVKVGAITTSESQYDSNGRRYFFAVTYPFEVNRDGWTELVLDAGYATLDDGTPRKRLPIFHGGQAPNEPQKLDGDGHLLAEGADPVFLPFDKYPVIDFNVFDIDFASIVGR